MKRTVVQEAIAETIRAALPRGFTLRGGRYLKYYKAHIWTKAPPDYKGRDCSAGQLLVARVMVRQNGIIAATLWKGRTPRRGSDLKRKILVSLEEPDSLDRLEKWASLLHLACLPWR